MRAGGRSLLNAKMHDISKSAAVAAKRASEAPKFEVAQVRIASASELASVDCIKAVVQFL